MASTSAPATMIAPTSAPMRLSRPPTSAGANALSPITTMVWSSPESSAISMPAKRIDRVEIDAALCRQQGVLPARAQSHAPPPEAQECEQSAIDQDGHDHHERRASRNPGAADKLDRGIGEPERLQRMLLRRRPDQHDQAAQQDADRDRGEDG